jgi:cell division protein FtsW (lipid II flippase)
MLGVFLLILVLIPKARGKWQRRWLSLFILTCSPELDGSCLSCCAADYTVRKGIVKNSFSKAFEADVIVTWWWCWLLSEPDMGVCGDLRDCDEHPVAGRLQAKVCCCAAAGLPAAFAALIIFSPYRMQRVTSFMDRPIPTAMAIS